MFSVPCIIVYCCDGEIIVMWWLYRNSSTVCYCEV